METSEQMTHDQSAPLKNFGPNGTDVVFILFVILALITVAAVGRLTYNEGKKTEVAKQNVEAWGKWLTSAGPLRAKPDFQFASCAYTPPTIDSAGAIVAVVAGAGTNGMRWAGCYKDLTAAEGPLGALRNAFTGELPLIAAKCDSADKTLAGSLVFEKLVPAPPGSAVPVVASPLVETDLIDQKMQLRISACDGGSYPTKPIELEF